MDLIRHLKYFVAVAELRNFGRAATRLGVTQPPVSQGLRRLEEQLGVRLVERSSTGASVTAEGAVLLPRAKLIVDDVARLFDEAERLSGPIKHLRWGIVPQVDTEIVTACIATLRTAMAEEPLPVTTVTAHTDELVEAVRRGTLHVAVVEHPALIDGLGAGPMVTLPRQVVVPAQHRAASADTPRAAMLAGLDFVTVPRSANPPSHDLQLDAFRRRGLDPNTQLASTHRDIAIAVASGTSFGLATAAAPVHTGTVHRRMLADDVALRLRTITAAGQPDSNLVYALDKALRRFSK
ncbi:LysR family transcriptional regulator [Antrihabitans stalactiti]|uniref:LysR family transcriptional regulator n=1 Tax=Antrihabitans stalactiti TaxID=2584121 RepID=UPI0030B8359E